MSHIRCALILSAGVAAGVSTAPYLCFSGQTPAAPPSRLPFYAARRSASGFHSGSSNGSPAEEDAMDAASRQASVASVTEGLSSLYRCACELLDLSTRALMEGTATAAAVAAAGAHAAANATTAGLSHRSPVCSGDAVVQCAGRDLSGAAEVEKHVADFATDAEVTLCASTQSVLNERTAVLRAAPHKLKDRFLHYAKRDPATGELVLSLEGFVRCMLLLPNDGDADVGWRRTGSGAASDSGAVTHKSPSTTFSGTADISVNPFCAKAIGGRGQSRCHSSWLQQLPRAVQQRFVQLFHWVDLNGNNFIGYAEFVVLFTFLSTPQQTLKRAFSVFDLEDSGRLSEWEFCHLLNTIMVDPAVQVRYAAATSGAGGRRGAAAAASPSSAFASATPQTITTARAPHLAPCVPPTPEAATPAVASAPRPTTARRAGTSRRSEQEQRSQKDCLNFEISSELMRPLLFGPLPLQVSAAPGSTNYDRKAALAASVLTSNAVQGAAAVVGSATNDTAGGMLPSPRAVSQLPDISHLAWWQKWGDTWRCLLSKVWTPYPSCAPASCDAACGTLAVASITEPAAIAATAAPSRLSQLQLAAQEDSLLHMVSYPTLVYRLDYLRSQLRAIEFGLCDPANTGTISLDDCRRLLRGDVRRTVKAEHPALQERQQQADETVVTWHFYQKMLDVIRESDRILAALRLALDAMPPVPEETLRGGAIPDEALEAATQAIPEMVRLSVLHYTSRAAEGAAVDGAPLPATAEVTASQDDGRNVADRSPFSPADVTTADAADGKSVGEGRAASRHLKASLVRPTALTWNQVDRVLVMLGTVTQLSEAERSLFRALLDDDGSDSLSPAEFARLCTLKEAFFAQQLPRFDEPKRNAVQQFFHCMQQLE
ncbi:conserved hypothetical protein [Leishmania infantum JPCM5]|uniref:Uncharacterized protein n=2 Tax=Leishmania infantum TaxID=5671 RepID=A4HZW6_LEIIN|nr:conserved hypothetical protein [Leishmania infantum JPCM5]CAC9488085.1 hypothetical_protein_-_conserved [Leishmania infantum]CAM68030.1 conserved hypothetical protein [Leishmania infantum JPCM5]SUZ41792.1 hypothetical_protein_-_conserved [Leishmania infantum]|eukprot:XP_001465607.1 conserved hypothetical protein [Leishmania infantum JPCM5]